MKYLCNPVNIDYHYQFNLDQRHGNEIHIGREAADPSMIRFHDKYYIFASMNLSVWVSEDLVHWTSHKLPESLPLYDYAPDARVLGDYVYLCASSHDYNCSHFRTKDILNGPYEEIKGDFDFWDPNLFADDDGRVYFYWGCSNSTPIWGVEKDPVTMKNIGEPVNLIFGDSRTKGYERIGEDNSTDLADPKEVEKKYQDFMAMQKPKMDAAKAAMTPAQAAGLDAQMKKYEPMIRGMFTNAPYIEGAWMTKHAGRYYLQYASSGAQYNVYNDGVYVSDKPLGPFRLQKSNPYSYKPGGFLPGAGHGSTMEDPFGNWWHAATMRVSMNFDMERRVGIWPAGFDKEGELFCNQRYGDWPLDVEAAAQDPWRDPKWFLMSYGAAMTASSSAEGKGPERAADENVRTWWQAAGNQPGEWLQMDLGDVKDVRMIQINFADDGIEAQPAGRIRPGSQARWIDDRRHVTRWKLEGSQDGDIWFVLSDKSEAETDLSHDIVLYEEGVQVRFLKLTIVAVPFDQKPAISGLRVFGIGTGSKPAAPVFTAERTTDLDMVVTISTQETSTGKGAVPALPGQDFLSKQETVSQQIKEGETTPGSDAPEGYNILWGEAPDKLYHSWMIFGRTTQRVGAMVKGEQYYVRVDAFNENGITEGTTVKLK